MFGAIVAALVAYWFYQTAALSGRQPLSWAIAGGAVYFIGALLWTLGVTPHIKDLAAHNPNSVWVWVVRYAYVVFGATCAAGVNAWLNKPGSDA